jgi:hypothetical protein
MNKVFSLKFNFFYALLALFMATSCNKNKCEDVVCGVNEDCLRAQCLCRDGYESLASNNYEVGSQILHYQFGTGTIEAIDGNDFTIFFSSQGASRIVSGNQCSLLAFAKYEGTYNISESCQGGPGHNVFFGTIQASQSPINELRFLNFLNSGQNAVAYITTDGNNQGNFLVMPNQQLGGSGFTVSGEGTYLDLGNFYQIQLNVQSVQGGVSKVCTITYQ